jgi:hypothetical protein
LRRFGSLSDTLQEKTHPGSGCVFLLKSKNKGEKSKVVGARY